MKPPGIPLSLGGFFLFGWRLAFFFIFGIKITTWNVGSYQLREAQSAYDGNFTLENGDLRPENTYFWENIL
jgi:hypothetical protein